MMDSIEQDRETAAVEDGRGPELSDWVVMGASVGFVIAMAITVVVVLHTVV